jgi:hypothetical protein
MRAARRWILLALGDAAALTLFALIGVLSHDEGLSGRGLARTALPILAGWFAAAAALRLYSRGGVGRLALTWALGVTAGVVLRGLILGRSLDGAELAFWAVSLAVTAVLVAAWRVIAWGLRVWPGTSPRRSGSVRRSTARPRS